MYSSMAREAHGTIELTRHAANKLAFLIDNPGKVPKNTTHYMLGAGHLLRSTSVLPPPESTGKRQ